MQLWDAGILTWRALFRPHTVMVSEDEARTRELHVDEFVMLIILLDADAVRANARACEGSKGRLSAKQ
jgi:hypothetical protein